MVRLKIQGLVISFAFLFILTGCAYQFRRETAGINTEIATVVENNNITPNKITPSEAKGILDSEDGAVFLDVRSQAEYDEIHIPGAVLLPDNEIADRAASLLPDKDALILVYCRSGRRSADAAKSLIDMGYKNVYDFGGILDWPFDTVSGM